MRKSMFLILILILLGRYNNSFAADESITIATYYLSPYGSYRELAAQKMKVGSTYSTKAAVNGLIRFIDN